VRQRETEERGKVKKGNRGKVKSFSPSYFFTFSPFHHFPFTHMQLSQVVAKLSGAKRSQAGFIAKCPAHEDERQSLSVGSAGSKVLLNCFAGCPPEKIVEAMGKGWTDLFEGVAPD